MPSQTYVLGSASAKASHEQLAPALFPVQPSHVTEPAMLPLVQSGLAKARVIWPLEATAVVAETSRAAATNARPTQRSKTTATPRDLRINIPRP